MNIRTMPEFDEWLSWQDPHSRDQIDDRLDRIREHNHFGARKYLGAGLFELRWRNGGRVYYAVAADKEGISRSCCWEEARMAKHGTSARHEEYLRGKMIKLSPNTRSRPYDPTITLRDPVFIKAAMLQALAEGDFKGVVDVYRSHLRVLNRTRSAKLLKVSRQSIHKMLKPGGTPSLRTFTTFMKFLEDNIPA